MELDLENPLTSTAAAEDGTWPESAAAALFAAESDHMCSVAGVDSRRDVVSLILQAQMSCNLDPMIAYLAVNYADRFLSKQQIPREKPWIVRLLAIACLSLATKMKKSLFSIADFQREQGFIFDVQTIRRMEFLILGALQWRMRSITPFSFLNFFLSFVQNSLNPDNIVAIKARASHILINSQSDIKTLEFRPSVAAAAALLSATAAVSPAHLPAFRFTLGSCEYLNKECLWECSKVMDGVAAIDGWDGTMEMITSSNTPVTVLCRADSDMTVGSSSDDRDMKKRRLAAGRR